MVIHFKTDVNQMKGFPVVFLIKEIQDETIFIRLFSVFFFPSLYLAQRVMCEHLSGGPI
jgi:hypothetical protein